MADAGRGPPAGGGRGGRRQPPRANAAAGGGPASALLPEHVTVAPPAGTTLVPVWAALGAGAVGGFAGYFLRVVSFRRDRRMTAYSNVVSTFLAAAHAGAPVVSFYIQLGNEKFFDQHEGPVPSAWEEYGRAEAAFDEAIAGLRLVGTDYVRQESVALQTFLSSKVRQVLKRDRFVALGLPGGIPQLEEDATWLAREFADRAHRDVVGFWPGNRRHFNAPTPLAEAYAQLGQDALEGRQRGVVDRR